MSEQTPALEYLLGTYFHQDFRLEHGGVWETVDAFISENPEDAAVLPGEIERVLSTVPESDLRGLFDDFGSEFAPQADVGGYHGFLVRLAQRAGRKAAASG